MPSQDKGSLPVSILTATEGLNKWALAIGILVPSTSQPKLVEDDWAGNLDRLNVRVKLSTNF